MVQPNTLIVYSPYSKSDNKKLGQTYFKLIKNFKDQKQSKCMGNHRERG